MTVIYKVYDQVADLIAQLESEKILSIQISAEMQTRFNALVEKSKQTQIPVREKDELNHFIVLERLFRLSTMKTYVANNIKK